MEFQRRKRIRFHHCDPAGIVFYPQYLVLCNEVVEDWFEDGLGVSFFRLHNELRRAVPMRRLEADFLAPSVHGEALDFSLTVEKVGASSLVLSIRAEKGGKRRFSSRQTVAWAALDGAPRAVAIDDEWRERFGRYLENRD